jgi:hypothetical protein
MVREDQAWLFSYHREYVMETIGFREVSISCMSPVSSHVVLSSHLILLLFRLRVPQAPACLSPSSPLYHTPPLGCSVTPLPLPSTFSSNLTNDYPVFCSLHGPLVP